MSSESAPPSVPMSGGLPVHVLHEAIGTILIGAFLNIMLFTVELTQIHKYLVLFPSDRLGVRLLVMSMFLVDCVATCNACAMVYLYTISHWGDPAFLQIQNATIPVYSFNISISLIFMHGFLIFRYYRLSQNWIISFVLAGVAVAAFVGDALATWSVIRFTALSDRPKLKIFVTIWFVSALTADLLIAAALIWELSRVKSSVSKTKSLIRRLITTVIMTGLATATLGALALSTYLAKPSTNICLIFGMAVGRAATLTVLYNLNMRKSTGNSSLYYHGAEGQSNAITGGATIPLDTGFCFAPHGTHNSVNVHQMSVVHRDPADKTTQLEDGTDDTDSRYDQKHRDRELV